MFFERVTLTCDQLWRKTCNWYIIKSLLIFLSFHCLPPFPCFSFLPPLSFSFVLLSFISLTILLCTPPLSLILTCFFSCLPHLLLLYCLSYTTYFFLSYSLLHSQLLSASHLVAFLPYLLNSLLLTIHVSYFPSCFLSMSLTLSCFPSFISLLF